MKPVRVENLTKIYGAMKALDDVSLEIPAGDLFFLLGPSGCGKTTLLRSIAGFITPEHGSIFIGDDDATKMPPQDRHTGMVFQSYALWPHMTIRENVAFGLRIQKVEGAERNRRVDEALETVRMTDQAEKKPNQLSGGQQQRVALARALVVRPSCLLLDEPLSNLDAKLRIEMRTEIRRICKQSGLTAIYVTHDQKEALSIADHIAIMRSGKIVQIGSPRELYYKPRTRFVADFMGQTNFLDLTTKQSLEPELCEAGEVSFDSPIGELVSTKFPEFARRYGTEVTVAIRPEAITRTPPADARIRFRAKITGLTYLGESTQYELVTETPQPVEMSALELIPGPDSPRTGDTIDWWVDPLNVMVTERE